jgi:hypothetical protein
VSDAKNTKRHIDILIQFTSVLLFGLCVALGCISLFGLVGISPDVDHIICALIFPRTWNPEEGQFGCRLAHGLILPISSFIGGMGITLWLGLWLRYAFRPPAEDKTPTNIRRKNGKNY